LKICFFFKIVPAFITHSASVSQIKLMYQFLLQDLRGKVLVDVGSRTGAVLYGVSAHMSTV